MIKIIVTFIVSLSVLSAHCQVGKMFPDMKAETLTNQFLNLPEAIKGKYSIIGFAYSKKSEQHLKNWYSPAYNIFIHKPENPSVFDITYDVNVYFIPMFTGAKRLGYKSVMQRVQKGLDKRLKPHILFYEGQLKVYKKTLGMQEKDMPHFFVLDPEGKIIYTTSGMYTDRKMQEIVDKVGDAMD